MLDVVSGLLQMHIRPLWRSKWDYTSFGWVWKVNINVEFRRWQLRSCTRLASKILVGDQRGLLGGSLPDRGRFVSRPLENYSDGHRPTPGGDSVVRNEVVTPSFCRVLTGIGFAGLTRAAPSLGRNST